MRSAKSAILLLTPLALLAGCGSNTPDSKVTETRMDDLDSIEGTISDEPVNTDALTEDAPIDPSAPAKPKAKSEDKEKPAEDAKAKAKPVEAAPRETVKVEPAAPKEDN